MIQRAQRWAVSVNASPPPISWTRSTETTTLVSALTGKDGTVWSEPPAHHCWLTLPVNSTTPLATLGVILPVPPSNEMVPTFNLLVLSGPEKSSEKTVLVI